MLIPGYPRRIAVALATLFVDTTANTALIFDYQGRVRAGQGDCLRADLKQQTALIAGTLKSSHEVQFLSDQPHDELLISQGARENLMCAELTPNDVLALLLPKEVSISQATVRTRQAIQELRTLLADG
jgi:hypothetical protein